MNTLDHQKGLKREEVTFARIKNVEYEEGGEI